MTTAPKRMMLEDEGLVKIQINHVRKTEIITFYIPMWATHNYSMRMQQTN